MLPDAMLPDAMLPGGRCDMGTSPCTVDGVDGATRIRPSRPDSKSSPLTRCGTRLLPGAGPVVCSQHTAGPRLLAIVTAAGRARTASAECLGTSPSDPADPPPRYGSSRCPS